MPSLNRYEKVTCENCGTETTKLNLACHKKRCWVGTLYCTQCPNFSTKSQNDLNYHIAKKHSNSKPDISFKCKLCYAEFPGFYALRQHRNTQHGTQMGSGTRDVDVEHIVGDVENHSLREKLRSCRHFLVDSELESSRHKVFNYAVETLNETIVNEKLDHFFKQFEMCSKSEYGFWLHFEKYRGRRFEIFLRTRKQNPAGLIQTCVHPWRLDKVERLSQPNWRHGVVSPGTNEHKVEVLQINKLDRVCCFTQRRTYGVQERSLTRTSAWKSHNQLSHVWTKHETTI